jgi:hypothetical protein
MGYLHLSDDRDQDASCDGVEMNHSVDLGSVDLLKAVEEVYVQRGQGSMQYRPDEGRIAVKEFGWVE